MSSMISFILVCFSLFNVANATDVLSQIQFPIEKVTLNNGLTVILQKDNSVPLISYNTWFRVGSKDEEKGFTGMAHLFEHMMFKGAKRYSGDEFSNVLRANGGNFNAFTTRDYTGYYLNLPSSKLDLAMDIESDRMVNLKLSKEMLDSEREVVKEERRFRYDNNVLGGLFEAIFEFGLLNHPYRWPVIGWMEDLDRITVDKAMDFYRRFYAPNNAVVVIVGDIQIGSVKSLLKKYYGALDAQKIDRLPYVQEPDHIKEKIENLYKDTQSDYVSYTYLIPRIGSPESYVFEVLVKVLGQGNSSRLHRRLVYESQLATGVSSYTFGLQELDLFQIMYSLRPEKDPVKKAGMLTSAKKIVDGELWSLRNKLCSEKEIQKAKNNIVMELVGSLKSFSGRGRALASNEVLFGSYSKLFSDIEKYMSVTPEEVRATAEKFLNPSQRTIIHLQQKKEK